MTFIASLRALLPNAVALRVGLQHMNSVVVGHLSIHNKGFKIIFIVLNMCLPTPGTPKLVFSKQQQQKNTENFKLFSIIFTFSVEFVLIQHATSLGPRCSGFIGVVPRFRQLSVTQFSRNYNVIK